MIVLMFLEYAIAYCALVISFFVYVFTDSNLCIYSLLVFVVAVCLIAFQRGII